MSTTASRYDIAPRNKFFEANLSINEYENPRITGFTFYAQVDLTEVEKARSHALAKKPSYTAFVTKAAARALAEMPQINGRVYQRPWLPFSAPRLQRFKRCDIAVACERHEPGMEAVAFCDVLRDADTLNIPTIANWLRNLANSDETGNANWRKFSATIRRLPRTLAAWLIRLPYFVPKLWVDYRGGAVLISSPAKYGVDAVGGTWPWPLGISFGLARQRPVVRGSAIVAAPTFTLTLTFDRRLTAGAQAARFFRRIVELLERANELDEPKEQH